MKRNILTEPELFTRNQIVGIEGHYDAAYVCETCLLGKGGGWVNAPVAVFYQDEAFRIPEGGSPWFGIFLKVLNPFDKDIPTQTMIVNAISAVGVDIQGVMADNGDVIYSHYRHDYRRSPDGSVWVDGGRDYVRTGMWDLDRFVTLKIVGGELRIMEPEIG